MRSVSLWIVLCAMTAGCGDTRFGLLPRGRISSRDPDPTRPLVETYRAPPRSENDGRSPRSPATLGRFDAAVSSAGVLSWLLGGAAPLLGAYGTFDEGSLFFRKPPPADGPGVGGAPTAAPRE